MSTLKIRAYFKESKKDDQGNYVTKFKGEPTFIDGHSLSYEMPLWGSIHGSIHEALTVLDLNDVEKINIEL